MYKKTFLFVIILSVLSLTACQIPVQMVYQTTPQPVQVQQHAVEDDTVAKLMGTMAVMETKLASLPTSGPPIIITATAANTVEPTAVLTSTSTATTTPTAITTPCNRAKYRADITIPDGKRIDTGDSFVKTWRMLNNGTCTWGPGYSLVFDHGDLLGGSTVVPLTTTVFPGGTVDLSVYLKAPNSSGTYQGYWMLQDPNGVKFGIGDDAQSPFWVKILASPYDSHAPEIYGSCKLTSVTPDLYTKVAPGTETNVHWIIKNVGSTAWTKGDTYYLYVSGERMYVGDDTYTLNQDVGPGQQVDIVVPMKGPDAPGYYTTAWGIAHGSTRYCAFSVTLNVK